MGDAVVTDVNSVSTAHDNNELEVDVGFFDIVWKY